MASYEKYWIERADRRIADRQSYLDASVLQIQDAYDEALKELNGEINHLFLRLVKETGLSRAEVKKLLKEKISSKELEEIRSKLDTITDEEILQQLRKKLDVSYYKSRISRQEALREAIHIQMSVIADKELAASTKAYTDVIREEYYHNIFDSQQFLGFAFNFVDLPEKVIEQILADDWSGKHYSKRIWGNSQTMAGMIEKIILKGAMKGTNSRKMAQELNKISKAGMYACERLIRTETTYFTAMADLEAAKARGTEAVQFVATLDTRTSEQCRAADGKIIPISEAKPGRNIPPLHPFCRSVIIDVIEGLVHKVRRARDPRTGETYKVAADMTYNKWKNIVKTNGILLRDDSSTERFKVRWDRINREKYNERYQGITGSDKADQALSHYAKEIFSRRDGTDIEETYLLNVADGTVLGHIVGEKREVVIPVDMLKLLTDADQDSIIILHNHPGSGTFSLGDIDGICGVGAIKGIVAAGHNGALYYAERPKYRDDFLSLYSKLKNALDIQTRHEVWSLMSAILGFKYERR